MTEWEILTLGSRWLLYLAMIMAIGGTVCRSLAQANPSIRPALTRYLWIGLGLGLLMQAGHFLIRTGSFAENGLLGMTDPFMLELLWQSGVGDAAMWRCCGFLTLLAAALLALFRIPAWLVNLTGLVGIGMLALSFSQTGHTRLLEGDARLLATILLAVHVALVGWWLGWLYPLWLVNRHLEPEQSRSIMDSFGWKALPAVSIAVLCGLSLAYLLAGWDTFYANAYGYWLTAKAALVAAMLLLAARHKFQLVPNLQRPGNVSVLSRSIVLETVLAGGVIVVTGIIALMIGPAGH